MIRMALAALVLVAGIAAAQAQSTRITNPDGTKVDVVTGASASTVTSYDPEGRQTDKLRYPGYGGEEGHARLLLLLSPPGAKHERLN
ncbi:MAG: hypothetical protein AAFW98_06040 [Pseudomonadota bacterium]